VLRTSRDNPGLEPRTFLRRFTQATGIKPSEYQKRLQISRAREILEFSRTGIEEIASRVGYNDVEAFRRTFRKISGLTPSDYRWRFSRLHRSNRPSDAGHFMQPVG
jgi:transcriptional regulator GlxA family with amidase domain